MEREIQQIKARYLPVRSLADAEAFRLFRQSFQRLEAIRTELPEQYAALEACYLDAEAVVASSHLPILQKERLLYAVYDTYFRQLSELSWPLRRKIGADKAIKQMQKAIKGKKALSVSLRYWICFCAVCLPPLLIGILGEVALLDLTVSSPPWQYVLSLSVMLLGFTAYVIACQMIEGRRLYGGLHKWLEYRQNPKKKARPMDFLQTAKMLVPLAASLAGALMKLL